MPRLEIINLSHRIISYSESEKSVLSVIHAHGIDWMHACGAKGRCTTCCMEIVQGMENLSPLNELERKFHDEKRLATNERQACQVKIHTGEVQIRVPKRYQFPHIKYSEDVY